MIIRKGSVTIKDKMDKLVETEHGVKCGCENPSLQMVKHIDGETMNVTQYICTCGNNIAVIK